MRTGPPLQSPAARPTSTPRTRSRLSPTLMIRPLRLFARDRGRRGSASRLISQQVDIRPLDQLVPGDAQSVHKMLGDAGPLILRLLGPQDGSRASCFLADMLPRLKPMGEL